MQAKFRYLQFVYVDRRSKIESGQRTTSFSYLLNDKRGAIGRALDRTRPDKREVYFMTGQFGKYNLVPTSHTLNAIYLSVFYSDRVAGGVPVVRQPSMEWHLPDLDLCCECVEWRRILHRSFWSQVCTAHHSFPFLCIDVNDPPDLSVNWRRCVRSLLIITIASGALVLR